MSRVLATIAIEDAAVEPLGVKEALVMAVEHLGGVQVLEIQLQEPEQLGMGGGAFVPPKPRPGPKSSPPKPAPSGQAPARSSRRPQTAMVCCFNCGCYRSGRGLDPGGNPYRGTCGRSGRPVYDVTKGCKGWVKLGQ